jgi:hypothetical protein
MLYNDDVNVPAVERAFGVSRADAEQCVPFGCGEPSRPLGQDTGRRRGLAAPWRWPFDAPGIEALTFDALWESYRAQVGSTSQLSGRAALCYQVAPGEALLLVAPLRLLPVAQEAAPRGRARFLGRTFRDRRRHGLGQPRAIRTVVCDAKAIAPDRLRGARRRRGLTERRLLQRAAKYGTATISADAMARQC